LRTTFPRFAVSAIAYIESSKRAALPSFQLISFGRPLDLCWTIELVYDPAVAGEVLTMENRKERGEIGYEMTEADLVWNRACDSLMLRSGDRALAGLLSFHGLAMNGGVLHALECLRPEELEAAMAGCRFLGFNDVFDFLVEAKSASETSDVGELDALETRLDDAYAGLVPSDHRLIERFERFYRDNRSHFAPLAHDHFPKSAQPPSDTS
jgi:hypothetical protein